MTVTVCIVKYDDCYSRYSAVYGCIGLKAGLFQF